MLIKKIFIFLFYISSLFAQTTPSKIEFSKTINFPYQIVNTVEDLGVCKIIFSKIYYNDTLVFDFFLNKDLINQSSFGSIEVFKKNNINFCKSFYLIKKIKIIHLKDENKSSFFENNEIVAIPESGKFFYVFKSDFKTLKFSFPMDYFQNSKKTLIDLSVWKPNIVFTVESHNTIKNLFCLKKINLSTFNIRDLSCVQHPNPITHSFQYFNGDFYWTIETKKNYYSIFRYNIATNKFILIEETYSAKKLTLLKIENIKDD